MIIKPNIGDSMTISLSYYLYTNNNMYIVLVWYHVDTWLAIKIRTKLIYFLVFGLLGFSLGFMVFFMFLELTYSLEIYFLIFFILYSNF